MTLVLYIGFHEPFSGAWMTGKRKFGVKNEKDAKETEARYAAYFKERYGQSADIIGRIEVEKS